MGEFKTPIIKTKQELEKILDDLSEQGFGYFNRYDAHQRKIEKIINVNNKLNVSVDSEFKNNLQRVDDYVQAEKIAKEHFSKFKPDDKINELLKKFSIQYDDSAGIPSNYADANEIIRWVEFRTKYNLKDEFDKGYNVQYYNLDKSFLKIYYNDNQYDFSTLYGLIYGKSCPDYDRKSIGVWIDLNPLELKIFANGYANIRGDIKKFKEYFYKTLKSERYGNSIIKYNDKIEIIKTVRD